VRRARGRCSPGDRQVRCVRTPRPSSL